MKYLIILLVVLGCSKKVIKPIEIIEPGKKQSTYKFASKPKVKDNINKYFDFIHIHFNFNQAELSDKKELDYNLKEILTITDRYGNMPKIILEGFCDERGTSEYNLALGDLRASVIKDYLIRAGYPSELIEVVSYGEEKPIDTNSNESAWAKNRRVEFKID